MATSDNTYTEHHQPHSLQHKPQSVAQRLYKVLLNGSSA